jgi:hypothetical protein
MDEGLESCAVFRSRILGEAGSHGV